MQGDQRAHRTFVILWTLATAVKLLIAARLPLFVDEAFYWQEGQHLAAAYSDLPGMTAWLARLGVELGGHHLLALRLPFLAIAALIPWLIAHIATRWFGSTLGWQAGSLTLLMPLSATLGILAVPDVPMALAAVLCMDAGARLLREVDATSALELAIGLVIGALSHYRFAGVIGVGCIALLCIPQGRAVMRDPRIWMALTVGAVSWLPLLFWNTEHDEAGLRFQLVDRHPWRFQITGLWFLLIQAVLVTPLLAWAMLKVGLAGTRAGGGSRAQWRYFGLLGGISTVAIFVLGFFSDAERISFHWPLPGYLTLLVAVPVILMRWPHTLRRAAWAIALLGTLGAYGYYLAVSVPSIRAHAAGEKYYPRNFAGWKDLARAVKLRLAQMPPGTRVLAENFKVGAEPGLSTARCQRGSAARGVERQARAQRAAAAVGAAQRRHARRAAAAGALAQRSALSRPVEALSRHLRDGRAAAAAHRDVHRSRLPALPAVRAAGATPARAVHRSGDGLDRHAAAGRARGRTGAGARLGIQGRRRAVAGGACCWTGARSRRPSTARRWMCARIGRSPPTRSTPTSVSTPPSTRMRCRRARIGWDCACMATTAASRTGGNSPSPFPHLRSRNDRRHDCCPSRACARDPNRRAGALP